MSRVLFAGAVALTFAALPGVALADDSASYARATTAERARDKAITTDLNRQALARAQARDAQYAQGWAEYRAYNGESGRVVKHKKRRARR